MYTSHPSLPVIYGWISEELLVVLVSQVALAEHPEAAFERSGKILMTTELAEVFEFVDVDGVMPRSMDHIALRKQMERPPKWWKL